VYCHGFVRSWIRCPFPIRLHLLPSPLSSAVLFRYSKFLRIANACLYMSYYKQTLCSNLSYYLGIKTIPILCSRFFIGSSLYLCILSYLVLSCPCYCAGRPLHLGAGAKVAGVAAQNHQRTWASLPRRRRRLKSSVHYTPRRAGG
jgi:hypothetical protein